MEYNYKESVVSDVRDWMADNEQEWKSVHPDDLAEWLSDVLFVKIL